jgi:glycosyltransferase involved in cell wall biosynthesis
MRILYHHRTLLDGAEGIHIEEMVRAFESLGHSVTMSSPGSRHGRPGALPALIRRTLPQWLFECAAAAHNLVERRQARHLLHALGPALLYKRHALNDVAVLDAAREQGTPSVLEVNALYSSDALQPFEPLRLRWLARRLEARALSLATLVVAVSTPLGRMISDLAPSARVMVLPNGANPERFSPSIDGAGVRARYGLPADALVAGWSGVVRAWHRLDLLVEALAAVPQVWLLVIGDGPDRARVADAARAHGVSERVRFTGAVPRRDMAAHLAAIDVGAVADDRTGYASPMKLLEYMAMGRPVIAPDLVNIRDIVAEGQEGLLFRPGDPAAVAGCLERLADPARRARLGAAARRRIVNDRNWVRNAQVVVDAALSGERTPHAVLAS